MRTASTETPAPGMPPGRRPVVPDRPARVRLPVMFQNWYRLSFLHWPCDPALLQAPAGRPGDRYLPGDGVDWPHPLPSHGLAPAFPSRNFVCVRLPRDEPSHLRAGTLGPWYLVFFARCRGRRGGGGGAPHLWSAVLLVENDGPRNRKKPNALHEHQGPSGGGYHRGGR